MNISTSTCSDTVYADTPDGTPVAIDFHQLIGEHTLVIAQTGQGKSVLLRKVEELALAAGYPIMVFDSDGDMSSLTGAAPDGILLLGGEHGEPAISIEQAIHQLPTIVAGRASIIFDIRSFDDDERASVVKLVLAVMMKLPPRLQQPYLIVIDEVQRFAPQRGAAKAASMIINVVKEGRRQGLTVVVASQRIADVAKAVTSQTKNRIFGHVSDASDRKRISTELGLSPRETAFLSDFDKGDFLVRGVAFGGSIDKVRVRMPATGKTGKDHMIARLSDPIVPIEALRVQLGGGLQAVPGRTIASASRVTWGADMLDQRALDRVTSANDDDDRPAMATLLIDILAQRGRGGMAKDELALLAGTTERRKSFQGAMADLLSAKMISVGTGTRVRIAKAGEESLAYTKSGRTNLERLAVLRAKRERADERIIACLSASGHAPLAIAEICARTGLGPRAAKSALQRLKRDSWVVERLRTFATSSALARLLGRRWREPPSMHYSEPDARSDAARRWCLMGPRETRARQSSYA